MSFKIGTRQIGDGAPCFIMAEVGLAHEGSYAMAHAYVDAVAKRGVDAVKFQCHTGDPVSEWRVEPEWTEDENRQAYWQRTGFTRDQWWGLWSHAKAKRLEFLCSPFSVEAVEMLNEMVEAWKVPSGKIADEPLVRAVVKTGKPIIASSGMATDAEILGQWAHAWLQCTSLYPCPPEKVGLYRAFEWADGLSDHSGTIYAGLAAVALGALIVEIHVCFSKEQGGFDAAASLDMDQLGQLVEGVRFIEKALRPVDKDALAKELAETRRVFMGEDAKPCGCDLPYPCPGHPEGEAS